MRQKFFISLKVYDYDSSPRIRFIEHVVSSEERGKQLLERLALLMKGKTGGVPASD